MLFIKNFKVEQHIINHLPSAQTSGLPVAILSSDEAVKVKARLLFLYCHIMPF